MLWEVISLSIQSFGFLLSKSLQSLLSHFSHVRLCATPQTAAHQAPPSLGFSRQERWRGLPFPSPIHESILIFGKSNTVKFKNKIKLKKKKKRKVKVKSLSHVRPSATPLQPSRLLCPWDFPGKSTRVGCHCLLRTIPGTIPGTS